MKIIAPDQKMQVFSNGNKFYETINLKSNLVFITNIFMVIQVESVILILYLNHYLLNISKGWQVDEMLYNVGMKKLV